MHDEKEINWYHKIGKTPPEHIAHGSEGDIQERMVKANPTNWRMEGNKLIADTDMGELCQFLPTDMILTGTDEKGLPILKKIDIKR